MFDFGFVAAVVKCGERNRNFWIELQGDLFDHESLVKAIKLVDVVISAVGLNQLGDQDKLISAIIEAGNVKVFIIYDHLHFFIVYIYIFYIYKGRS